MGDKYADFEVALIAVLTDQEGRAELREGLHRARASIDRSNSSYYGAVDKAVAAKDRFLEEY